MSHNSFGHLFRVTTWGESHGPAIGCVVDGTPPHIPLQASDIQVFLDQRRPAQSRHTTQRKELDRVEILSGVMENEEGVQVTTGTPISLIIHNEDQRSRDYGDIKDRYRPGHADYTYDRKYGIRDYRGGGRSSARETAMRVAAGAVARKILQQLYGQEMRIRAAMVQMGDYCVDVNQWDWAHVNANPFFCPDAEAAETWAKYLDEIRKAGSSIGAVVQVEAEGIPAGIGAPVYGKLDAEIAGAMMGINAVKGVEIGAGMGAAALSGEKNADRMRMEGGKVQFLSNQAGGVLGGISTGQPLVVRMALKPTSSILTPVETVTRDGQEVMVQTKGRHDPCVGIRAVPVAEAMLACVLADQALRHRAQCGA